jgi:hypothetical protein
MNFGAVEAVPFYGYFPAEINLPGEFELPGRLK